ncbi:hypothetical protein M3J09_002013 [Ascochyta lentis]
MSTEGGLNAPAPSGLRQSVDIAFGVQSGNRTEDDLEMQSRQPAEHSMGPLPTAQEIRKAALETIVVPLEECPRGYPQLAGFTASDQNFMLFRGFSDVRVRLLLHLQAEIAMLEEELKYMDEGHQELDDGLRLRSLKTD